MKLPEPITMLESIEQLKHLMWSVWYEITGTQYAEHMLVVSHARAFDERVHVVGLEQAVKDYYG